MSILAARPALRPLAELRETLRQPGKKLVIEAKRGDATLTIELTTRRLI
jgi:hypothetical protein